MVTIRKIYFSFPFRLLVLHIRNHFALVAIWCFMALLFTGVIGRFFGVYYLLLTPEYRGQVDFLSFFVTGIAFGWFYKTWNLTTYLLSADRFPFLAAMGAPFTKFSLNNSVLPLLFLIIYLAKSVHFQWTEEYSPAATIALNIFGFLLGMIVLIFILSGYFFLTNKDIYAFLNFGKLVPIEGGRLLVPGRRLPTLQEIQMGENRWRVDTYLSERLHIMPVRSVAHYNRALLAKVFQQNHLNAVLVQVTAIIVLIILGMFMHIKWFRIPAGASLFLLMSMAVAFFGAVAFWFRNWSTVIFLCILLTVNYITRLGFFNYKNPAYGVNYTDTTQYVPYTYDHLTQLCAPNNVADDKRQTLAMLERWKSKQIALHPGKKPKMAFICMSGGGMRSAVWTIQCLQQLDHYSGGKMMSHTVLMSGASGGMYGGALFREAILRKAEGEAIDPYNPVLVDYLSKDLLNPICFAIVSNDLFFPLTTFKSGQFRYRRDRGYLMERTLNENCNGMLSRTLQAYQAPEANATIPMMILSPFVRSDGRQMQISPQGISYMMKPSTLGVINSEMEIDAIDYGKMFGHLHGGDIKMSTMLRLNSTYPLLLPNVWLPTKPEQELMDAGIRDNFGILTASRFVHVFSDWIKENTSGVVIVQIRCWEKNGKINQDDHRGVVENLIGNATVAQLMTTVADYEQDNALALLDGILGKDKLDIVRLIYRPVRKADEAKMNLHLSKREKNDIISAFFNKENLHNMERLNKLLNE